MSEANRRIRETPLRMSLHADGHHRRSDRDGIGRGEIAICRSWPAHAIDAGRMRVDDDDRFAMARGPRWNSSGQEARDLPATTRWGGTTFGHFAFRATEPAKPDAPPFYGLARWRFANAGQLVAGIVFTAPVMLLEAPRRVQFYEVDAGKRVVRYCNAAGDPWIEYAVKPGWRREPVRRTGRGGESSGIAMRRNGLRTNHRVRPERGQCPPDAAPPALAANGGFAATRRR